MPQSEKAGEVRLEPSLPSSAPSGVENVRGRTLAYEDLARCFHLPINSAAKELGVCVTALKKQCRKHGVPRWPHRKLKSLDKLKEKLEREEATAADKEYYKHEIHSIAQKKHHIFRSTASETPILVATAASSSIPNSALRTRPNHAFVMDPSMAPYPRLQVIHKPGSSSAMQMKDAPSAARDSNMHHQHRGPVVVPFAQVQPAPGAPFAAPSRGPAGVAHPYYFCGIHPPVVAPHPYPSQPAANGAPVNRVPSVQYYNPAAGYAYGPAIPGMAPPYQNMVQVNVMEQPSSFPHYPPNPNVPLTAATVTKPSANATPSCTQQATPGHTEKPGFSGYGNKPANGSAPVSGYVYNVAPHVMHYDGMVHSKESGAPVHRHLPGYWREIQHQQTPSNLVTMCNQTVHHHHHHGAETASPSLLQKDPAHTMQADNASVKTPINRREGTSDVKIPVLTETNDKRTESNENGEESQKVAFSKQDRASEGTDEKEIATNGIVGGENTGSLTQSDTKGRMMDEETEPNAMKTGPLREVSDTSRYSSGRKEKADNAGAYVRKGPSKRKRTHFSGNSNEDGCDNNEEKKVGDGDKRDSNSEVGRKVANADKGTAKNALGEMKSGRNWSVIGTGPSVRNDKIHGKNEGHEGASSMNWARRYDHVVHQCVGLASAQWCTDTRFTVTLAIGPKGLLGYAGVPSLGRSVLEGTETAIEDRQTTKNKYAVSLKGKRLEWIAHGTGGRYLIVLNPYRKRNNLEVCGVSGLMVELKIVQALSSS